MLNPHLFTHLFYEGVIVSTRKLVYDSGSNEEAIKALMQAQHKAVMKDLRKGTFDEKIDQYLGGTPGLEPRARGGSAAPLPRGERASTEADPVVAQEALDTSGGSPIEIVTDGLSEPIELPLKQQGVPTVSRTDTGDRTIPVDTHRSKQPPPPSADIDGPTLQSGSGGDIAAAINEANQVSQPRTKTAPKVSRGQIVDPRAPTYHAPPDSRDSAPVIEVAIDEDEISARLRGPRDTAVEEKPIPPTRPASHGAATLPKSPPRAAQPPMVSARPATQDRKREDSHPVEIHSPAPPSVEPPPGERSERPGQYSMSRKEGAAPMREKTGRIAAINPASPSNQPPPRRPPSGGAPVVPQPQSSGRESGSIPRAPQGSGPPRTQQQPQGRPSQQAMQNPPPVQSRTSTPPAGSRMPTPRNPQTAPITNRTPSPATPAPGSGVVMTRPAVIVGAPPKPPAPPQQRVRKAREDEGRGFGQGLISEKSLDEVILAYLSEDAEDK